MALARSKYNDKQNIGVVVRMKNHSDIDFWLGAIEKSKEKIIDEILKRLLK